MVPMRRSLTDPPLGATGRPQVQQEQTIDSFSQLHVSSGARHFTSTPKHRSNSQSQDSSPDHELLIGTHTSNHFKNSNAYLRPSDLYEPDEPLSMNVPSHQNTSSYDPLTHTPTSFSSEQSHVSSYNVRHSSKTSQDTCSQPSRSATVSRESSFRSLYSSSSQQSSLQDKASQVAHMAIDMMAMVHMSRERLSQDWYRSSSISSLSSSARALPHSDTNSVHSEYESENSKPMAKKQSQSFHGRYSSRAPHKRKERRPSAPPGYRNQEITHGSQHQSRGHHSPTATDEVDSEDSYPNEGRHGKEERSVAAPTEDYEPVSEEESATLTLRPRKKQRGRSNSDHSENQRLSVISDATPRQSVVMDPATISRHSTISEATSEGTVISPTASMLGRGKPCV